MPSIEQHPGWQASPLADLARAAADTRDRDRAEDLACTITDRDSQAMVLTRLARTVAYTGNLNRAEALANRAEALALAITNRHSQAKALADVASAVATGGNLDRAETLARAIPVPSEQGRALADVAMAVAAAGDLDRAETLTRAITARDPRRQAEALANLAKAVAAAGDLNRAETLARAITYPEPQARALTELARQTFGPKARRLVASAFRLGSWKAPLNALVQIQPAVLPAIVDELLERTSSIMWPPYTGVVSERAAGTSGRLQHSALNGEGFLVVSAIARHLSTAGVKGRMRWS